MIPRDSTHESKNQAWSLASFSIFSGTLTHEEISAAIQVKPTRTHSKGQPRGFRNKDGSISQSIVWTDSAWHLESPLGDDRNLAEHIKWLLDAIEPKLDIVRTLSAEGNRVRLFCGVASASGQGGFTLDSDTLLRISRLGISLSLDLYPPGASEEIPDEAEAG